MGKNANNKGISSKEIDMDDRMARSDDDNDNDNDNDNTGIGRTYECSYCKRGFTNAQALGGHMNIHRKDKAKAKNPTFSSSSSISYKFDDNQVSPYSSTNMTTPQWNHQAYYNPIPNPRSSSQPSSYYGINNSSMGKSSLFGMYEHDLGTDLSLRISNSRNIHQEVQEKKDDNCEDDIDLELRLGYDP